MIYKNIQEYSDDEIMNIIYNGNDTELAEISLSVGEYHTNYFFAQDVCFFLLDNPNEEIRANALLGLSYIARRFHELDTKKMILLLKLHSPFKGKNLERAEYAMEDISLLVNENVEFPF